MNDEEYLAENLRQDYLNWAGHSGNEDELGVSGRFTFCNHPFVYEPATKAAILGSANSAARGNVRAHHQLCRQRCCLGFYPVPPGVHLGLCSSSACTAHREGVVIRHMGHA